MILMALVQIWMQPRAASEVVAPVNTFLVMTVPHTRQQYTQRNRFESSRVRVEPRFNDAGICSFDR
jgi:hypothetical protein